MADDSAQSLLLDARTAHDSGDLAGAERLYRRVLSAQPANADALHQFGVLACQQGNTRMAAKRIRRAIAIDGHAADFHLNLGVVLETAGDLDGALQCYRNALDRGAAALETLLRIENIVRQNRRYGVFAEILSKFIAAQPGLAEAHYLIGIAHTMLEQPRDAASAFRAVIALTPNYAPAHANLATVSMDMGEAAGAIESCDDCLALEPGHTDAFAVKAIAVSEIGDDDARDALLDLDSLLQIGMLDPPAGFGSIADFNAALVRDIHADPTLMLDPNHRSCHFSEQTGDLMQAPSPAFAAFGAAVQAAVRDYCRRLSPESRHPFLANPRPSADLVVWATVMNAQGHQSAHIHPSGWLSGVYYPALPDLVRADDDAHLGWIEFGRPPDRLPLTAEPRLRLIEPVEGMLLLFPSYIYHRTLPYDAAATRISIAFDLDTEYAKQA